MMQDDQAVRVARDYLAAHYPAAEVRDVKLEQAIWDHIAEIWKVTLSCAPSEAFGAAAPAAKDDPLSRVYKVLLIDPVSARVLLLQDIHYSLPRAD